MKRKIQPQTMDIYDALERRTKRGINCIQVGVIQSFDTNSQLATVEIAMKQVTNVDDKGVKTIKDYPLLVECPCVTIQGGGDFISFPISKGDNCLVLFNDRDIDYWLNNGAGGVPTTTRMHDISDGFALVGLNPLTQSIVGYLANGIRLSHGRS